MEFTLYHLYPDLMNLYGSYANVLALGRLLGRLRHTVRIQAVVPGEDAELGRADFVFMGAGTERRQRFAMADLARYGGALRDMAERGCPMLFVGTAMELLGKNVTTRDGETYDGVGLNGFTSVQGERRIVGDVYGYALPRPAESGGDLSERFPVVGFMNKCAILSGVTTPLLTSLDMGFGNEAERGAEGYHAGNVFASELTGPLLVKNPQLLKAVCAAVLSRRGVALPKSWPIDNWWPLDTWAVKGYQFTEQKLRARHSKG